MDKQKEISIESLNIKIGGRELNLSVEEAKKLKKALEDLFGRDVIHEHHDHWYYRQWTQPYYPNWGTVYCSSKAGDNSILATNSTKDYANIADGTLTMSIT